MVRFAPIPTTAKSMGLAEGRPRAGRHIMTQMPGNEATGVPFGAFALASLLFGAPWSALSALVGSTLASLPEILEGRGEEKMREMLRSSRERPLLLATLVLLSGLAVAFLWGENRSQSGWLRIVRTQKMMQTYKEWMQKAS